MKLEIGILLVILGGAMAQFACPATGMEPFDYAQALCMSPLFYEAQRSGRLPPDQRVTWRNDAHLNDGQDNAVDLTGGYYDAGDYVKFGFPFAYALTGLSWGLIAYPEGYESAGQTEYVRQTIKWGTDYLLRAYTEETELYGQVGEPDVDNSYWGRPEDEDQDRPSYKINAEGPGTDLAAESASALAAASIVFQDVDSEYSQECLEAAIGLFDFANDYRGLYTDTITQADGFYTSYGYEDELPWGALWLYQATGNETYLELARNFTEEFGTIYYAVELDWDSKNPGTYALMAELDGSSEWTHALETYVDTMIDSQHTPLGLVYISMYGTLREAMDSAFVALRAASLGIKALTYIEWAQQQVDYALGSTGRSFVCGFGVNPPTQPHHAASSCPLAPEPCGWDDYASPDPNPQVLYGALVGGPDENDTYVDDRSDYIHNEVGLDVNALFTGCLAAMVTLNNGADIVLA